MAANIKFGTDGWRGVIAEDFTFSNVELVSIACAEQFLEDLKNNPSLKNTVFIGYDRRFLGEDFAKIAASVFSHKGFNTYVYNTDVPTPLVSFDVKTNSAVGGIVITASHNPAKFSGYKIKQPHGCSAPKPYTDKIEARLNSTQRIKELSNSSVNLIEPSKKYTDFLKNKFDLEKLKALNETIIVDSMYGSGGHYIENLLSGGKLKVKTIRGDRDVTFSGINPEPIMPHLKPLSEEVVKNKALIGLATDGDADRTGAVYENGDYLNTHKVLAILLHYLVEKKNLSGAVAITVSQSALIKKMAKKYGLKLFEVPVGFKHIADLMLTNDILIGAEESNGIGTKLHCMPERDGIFNALLLVEAINAFGMKPTQIVDKLHKEFRAFYYDRVDLHISNIEIGKSFVQHVKSNPPKEVNGQKVKEVLELDGAKLILEDDSWLLFRASGTEPLLRVYSEALSTENVKKNLKFGQAMIKEKEKVSC